MNKAHLHLMLNHFPLAGLFFGIAILLYAVIKKDKKLNHTAYLIFIFCMIMGKATMMTGEGAEHIVEELGISHKMIHIHEEKAEWFMKIMYLLGFSSIFGLYFSIKRSLISKFISYFVLIFACIASYYAKSVGTSGGEIRHTEIRTEAVR